MHHDILTAQINLNSNIMGVCYVYQLTERENDKMFCRHCGRRIAADSSFCMYCGAKIELTDVNAFVDNQNVLFMSQLKAGHCRVCGTELHEGENFCTACGTRRGENRINKSESLIPCSASASENKNLSKKSKKGLLIAGIIATVFLSLVIVTVTLARKSIEKKEVNSEKIKETEEIQYDTAYPDDVVVCSGNYITVEMAQADLLDKRHDDCFEFGSISFDRVTYNYPSMDRIEAVFWFDISVPYQYGNENYRAKITYSSVTEYGQEVLRLSGLDSGLDVWQVESELTCFGVWQYDDGETKIWVNFIQKDDIGYIAEYSVEYQAHYWSGSEKISYRTSGAKTIYGDNEWDGNTEYLNIDLDVYDDNLREIDLGRIKVYPWSGLYWDALHVYGGPYPLSQG